jgi:hypothetical protein
MLVCRRNREIAATSHRLCVVFAAGRGAGLEVWQLMVGYRPLVAPRGPEHRDRAAARQPMVE